MPSVLKEIFDELSNACYKHCVLAALVLTIFFTGLNIELFYLYRGEFFYTDTDCYTRALRMIDWLSDFQWSEKLFPYFNPASGGFELHWTRICDMIWLVFTLPFLPFCSLKDAVFYGGMFFSPLFMALTLAAILWCFKLYLPELKNKSATFFITALVCLFIANKVDDVFNFCRPDHHSLMCFVYCFNIAVILHNYLKSNVREMFAAGILCGLGMWASSAIEGLFVVALMLIVLAVNRIFYRHRATELLYFSVGLFLSVALAWLINPSLHGWMSIDINRLGIVHVVLTALMMLAFLGLTRLQTENKIVQICGFVGAALVCAFLMLLIFGINNLIVPIYHPEIYAYFIPRINEMKPLGYNTFLIPFQIFSVATVLYLFWSKGIKSMNMVDLAIFFVITFIFGYMVRRCLPYYIGTSLFVIGLGLFDLAQKAEKSHIFKYIKYTFIIFPVMYLTCFSVYPGKQDFPKTLSPLLTEVFYAPAFMFQHGVDTVGGPYHSNIEGIIDNYRLWFADDEKTVKELIKKHQVRALYLPAALEFYEDMDKHPNRLYTQIYTNKVVYTWLEKAGHSYYIVNYDKF